MIKLWESLKEEERVDLNYWQRISIPLNIDHAYRIVIEATVGGHGEGDIGVDDVSFTPACR